MDSGKNGARTTGAMERSRTLGNRIGIISDTHGLLRDEVKRQLQGCARILHAGDVGNPSVLEELNQIAPTIAVRGNVDKEWAECLPMTKEIEDIGLRVFMVHNKKHIPENMASYDLILYGHSHKYEEKLVDGMTWLNPGSCGPRRFRLPITMAILQVEEDGRFCIERIDLADATAATEEIISAATVKEHLPAIIKEIEKGRTVEQIARRFHLSKELSEQICRMYLTHPGVDADGIMARLGI